MAKSTRFRLPVNNGVEVDQFAEDAAIININNFVLNPDGSALRPREGYEVRRNDGIGYGATRKQIYFVSNPPDINYGDMIVVSNPSNERRAIENTEVVRTTNTVATENPLPMPSLPPTPDTGLRVVASAGWLSPHSSGAALPLVLYGTDTGDMNAFFVDIDISASSEVTCYMLSENVLAVSVRDFVGDSTPAYHDVYLYRVTEDLIDTGAAFAGGLSVTMDNVAIAPYWKKLRTTYQSTQIPAVCAMSETQAAVKQFTELYIYDLSTGTATTHTLDPLPNPPEDPTPGNSWDSMRLLKAPGGKLVCSEGRTLTTEGTNNNYVWVSVIDPADGSVSRTLVQQTHWGVDAPWHRNPFTDIDSNGILYCAYYKTGTSAFALATFDVNTETAGSDIDIPGITSIADDVQDFRIFGSYAYFTIDYVGVVEVDLSDGSVTRTYEFGAQEDFGFTWNVLPCVRDSKIWMNGISVTNTDPSGNIRSYLLSDGSQASDDAFAEKYGGEDWADNSYTPFGQTYWSRTAVYDPFLTRRKELEAAFDA